MFRNPVLVDGFPIRDRRHDEVGLELSVEMMSALGEAPYATAFAGSSVLKGFSTLFVPTAHADRSITWHFLFNDDGSRLSYHGIAKRCAEYLHNDEVNLDFLSNSATRNFVGWTSLVTRHLGLCCLNRVHQTQH